MGDYKRIFLVLDPSRRHTPAFHRAVSIARASGAHLHLALYEHAPALGAMGLVDRPMMEKVKREFRREREHALDRMALHLSGEGILTSSEVEIGPHVADAIATRVLDLSPDLVIKDAHPEPALKRIGFTPLDWQLLRVCPAPLLFVSGDHQPWPRRAVAAVDTLEMLDGGAALNDRIVSEALRLCLQCNGELHLLHAFEGVPPAVGGPVEGIQGIALAWQQLAELDQKRFEEFAARHGVPPERKHLLTGPSAQAIASYASDAQADLVVLGTVYRTGLGRLLMGSTAEKLLNLVHCDVLAVQPEGFRADVVRHLGLYRAPVSEAA